jgi:hypothetical protein
MNMPARMVLSIECRTELFLARKRFGHMSLHEASKDNGLVGNKQELISVYIRSRLRYL